MVPLKWARLTEQTVRSLGCKQYTFREYKDMGHTSSERVNNDLLVSFDRFSHR